MQCKQNPRASFTGRPSLQLFCSASWCSRVADSEFTERAKQLRADDTTVSFCCPCDYPKMPRGKEGDVPSLDTRREETRPVLFRPAHHCFLTRSRYGGAVTGESVPVTAVALQPTTAAAAMVEVHRLHGTPLLRVFIRSSTHPSINCSNWGWRCFQRCKIVLTQLRPVGPSESDALAAACWAGGDW